MPFSFILVLSAILSVPWFLDTSLQSLPRLSNDLFSVYLCVSSLLIKNSVILDYGPTLFQYDLILPISPMTLFPN